MTQKWLLFQEPPQSGSENMERDRELLNQHCKNDIPPVLRFYEWESPTLSIGRFQRIPETLENRLTTLHIPIVKRPTGGQAVLHCGDLTFSVIASAQAGLPGDVMETYCAISKAIIQGLLLLGIVAQIDNCRRDYRANPNCFHTVMPSDIHCQGKKLVGSAQTRKRAGFLQQSSLSVNPNFERLSDIFGESAQYQTGIYQLLETQPSRETIVTRLIQGFQEVLKISFDKKIANL